MVVDTHRRSLGFESSGKTKVALFGFYKYGNFGDDLMAILFGRELRGKGVVVNIYGIDPNVAREEGMHHSSSINDLLTGVDAVIYGGGGLFLTGQRSPRSMEFEQDIEQLCDICEKHNIPLYLLSVGGNGLPVSNLSKARRRLLELAKFISFRSDKDLVLTEGLKSKHEVSSDVVWASARYFKVKDAEHKGLKVGLDASLYKRIPTLFLVLMLQLFKVLRRQHISFVVLDQVQSSRNRVGCISYHTLEQFVREIASVDLLITHRLHMGMVGMAFGVPVVQILPRPKAYNLFMGIGLNKLCYSGLTSLPAFLKTYSHIKGIDQAINDYSTVDLNQLTSSAERHFSLLGIIIDEIERFKSMNAGDLKNG